MPFDLSMKGRIWDGKSEFFIYEVVVAFIEIGADRMKNFVRLLIVGLLLVGLSGVVSAEKFSFDKPIPVSFQVPDEYNMIKAFTLEFDEEKELVRNYHIGNSSLHILVTPLGEETRKYYSESYSLYYTYDHYGARNEKMSVDIFYEYKPRPGYDMKFVTLDMGHRAKLRTNFSSNDDQSIILEASHRGFEIELSIYKEGPMTYEEKKLAYQILMSLDF